MLAAQTTRMGFCASSKGRVNRAVIVKAARADFCRRDMFAMLTIVPAVVASPAFALIPDDDDEELVEKAKANRAARLSKDREANREFVSAQGFRDRSIESSIVPVQTGVYKLAMAGEQLEGGDLSAASATLEDGWVSDFENACNALSLKDDARSLVPIILASIKETAAAASSGDLTKAKVNYVSLVEAVESWAVGAGVSTTIKGL